MLKSLTVSNFKIFESPVTIDFSATGNYAFNKDAVKDGISKTSVMYGKNASGKSSLALAIFDIVSNLTDNFVSLKDYVSYLNANSNNKPAEFKYVFYFDGKEVLYEYKKLNTNFILYEKLIIDGKTAILYDRQTKQPVFEVNLPGTEKLNKNPNILQISALKWVKSNSILEKTDENILFEKMFAFVNKMLLFWSLQDRSFVGYSPFPNYMSDIIIQKGQFSKMQEFFRDAGIKDEITHIKNNGIEQLYIKFGDNYLDFFSASSQGMNALLLFFSWLGCCKNETEMPSFVCIDEFDAYYHYELSYFIIEFLKKLNCQALLTTHNTAIFTNDLLRPDCYFICTKEKITNVHNATEKEIREGHNLEKLYRGGTFGK